ncbi:hypothetical protein XHC_1278 [Xanthomonas hortorum pv. carotae str. M081]|nr:hypothetical protein XHC_1278 [Xanthomonas hortorum pv. carotae str. M081]
MHLSRVCDVGTLACVPRMTPLVWMQAWLELRCTSARQPSKRHREQELR